MNLYRKRMHHMTSAGLMLGLFAASATAPLYAQVRGDQLDTQAGQAASQADMRVTKLCARPFNYTGQIRFPPNYSGDAGEFSFPTGVYLRIDSASAVTHQPGLRGADIGGNTDEHFNWHAMRLEGAQATYQANRDGAIYLGKGGFGKVVIYRQGAAVAKAGSGHFTINGCLVEKRAATLRKPEMQVPRLPPQQVHPRLPIEGLKPGN